jgi:hypothetical protein
MKIRLINSLLALVFVLTMASCKKQEDVVPNQKSNTSSFRVSKTVSPSNFGESAYTTFTIVGTGGKYATFTFKPGGTNMTSGFQAFNTVNPGGTFVISQEVYLMLINGDFDMDDMDGDGDDDDNNNNNNCNNYTQLFTNFNSIYSTANPSCSVIESLISSFEALKTCSSLPQTAASSINSSITVLEGIVEDSNCD